MFLSLPLYRSMCMYINGYRINNKKHWTNKGSNCCKWYVIRLSFLLHLRHRHCMKKQGWRWGRREWMVHTDVFTLQRTNIHVESVKTPTPFPTPNPSTRTHSNDCNDSFFSGMCVCVLASLYFLVLFCLQSKRIFLPHRQHHRRHYNMLECEQKHLIYDVVQLILWTWI